MRTIRLTRASAIAPRPNLWPFPGRPRPPLVNFDWGRAIQPGIASPEVAAQNIAFMQRKLYEQAAGLSATQRAQARARAEAAYARCR